jgi:hypothetical protein
LDSTLWLLWISFRVLISGLSSFQISHSSKIEWLLPGLKGTDRDLSVPIVSFFAKLVLIPTTRSNHPLIVINR